MKNLFLIVAVVLSQALSAQSKELVEFVESLELGNVDIQYADTFEESNALAIISNVDLPMVLEGVKPFRKERSRLANFYHYRYDGYVLLYVKWKDGGTALGVFNELKD